MTSICFSTALSSLYVKNLSDARALQKNLDGDLWLPTNEPEFKLRLPTKRGILKASYTSEDSEDSPYTNQMQML